MITFTKLIKSLCVLVLIHYGLLQAEAQKNIQLYHNEIPNSHKCINREYSESNPVVDSLTYKVSVPSMQIFFPGIQKENQTAVIICPGGGYGVLLTKREGSDIAKKFVENGVVAIVLKYRLPDSVSMKNPAIGPLQDLQKAIFSVRQNAKLWGINPGKIGVMGFSAGGHLAASAGVHNKKFWVDTTARKDINPDFMILINPVISFTEEIGHKGTRKNLLGSATTRNQIDFFSNEFHVDESTSPAFLVHNSTDSVVVVENSLLFFEKLRKFKIPAEIHIYEKGEHGFLSWPSLNEWFGRCINWMKGRELVAN